MTHTPVQFDSSLELELQLLLVQNLEQEAVRQPLVKEQCQVHRCKLNQVLGVQTDI